MKKTYSAKLIAKYIIYHEKKAGRSVSNLKLQKLLYFVQAGFFAYNGEPCFEDKIHAWSFGPVVEDVYCKYRIYGGSSIPEVPAENVEEEIDSKDRETINDILDFFGYSSNLDMMKVCFEQKPWKDAYYKSISREITKESMRNVFSK